MRHIKLKSETSNRLRTSALLLACFAVPCAILLLVYWGYGIAPFGEKSLLIMDMSAQYSEFFCGLKNIGAQNGGILFSWSKVFGSNYAGVFAYYLASPLSFLTLLCPNEAMPVGLAYLTVLKIGLCGLTFGILLNELQKKARVSGAHLCSNRIWIAVFSVFYALMSYNIVYSMCLMWLDAVIWLPIVILGIEKITDGGTPVLLGVSYTVLFLSTYYISYMVGLFSCIYFLFALIRKKGNGLRGVLAACGKFVGSAAAAACAGAWLLLPTLYSLCEGKIGGASSSAGSANLYEFSDVLKKFFLGTYDSITNSGAPFFYCGIIVFAFYFAFYFTKTISRTEKLMTAAITVFLGISTYFYKLDLMWHVFQKPNWFPYRYSFILTFFIIFTAAKAFLRFREVPYAVYPVFFLLAAGFYLYVKNLPQGGVGEESFRWSVLFLLVNACLVFAAVILHRVRPNRVGNSVLLLLLLFASAGEAYANARLLTEGLDRAHGYESYEKYRQYKLLTQELTEQANLRAARPFYRMGADFQRNFNEAIGLGYAGISHYSSSYNKNINSFLYKMGLAQIYFWSSYAGSTTVTDTLFSVRYVMSDPEISRLDDDGKIISWCSVPYSHYITAAQVDTAVLYENPYVLPPCFAVSSRLKDFAWQANGVESQNHLLNCMLDTDASYFIKLSEDSYGAVSLEKDAAFIEYTVTAPESGPLYAYFPKNGNAVSRMSINGGYEIRLYTGETDCIQYLGSYTAGEQVRIRIYGSRLETSGNTFYQLDLARFSEAAAALGEGSLQISEWSSGYLKGSAELSEDGVMFTSLVYDPAWRVLVDGVPAETWALQDGLLCFDLTAGYHEIEIRYHVPGFAAGITLTGAALVAAAALLTARVLRNRAGKRSKANG